jgi:hypothetical protein
MRTTTHSPGEGCGRVTALYDPGNLNPVTLQSTLMVPIMLGHNSSQMVGIVGGQFRWGKFIASIIPDHVSGNYLSPYSLLPLYPPSIHLLNPPIYHTPIKPSQESALCCT